MMAYIGTDEFLNESYNTYIIPRNIVVVAVKERKSNCNVNENEVIKIIAEYKSSKYTCND
jgi:hypothetical protein